jgi:hypothetical protein
MMDEIGYYDVHRRLRPMAVIYFILINAGVLLAFFKLQRKLLHPVEIFLYWCLSTIIVQNYSAIQTMNMKSSIVPFELSSGFAHLLNRTVLYPVLALMLINGFCALKCLRMKLICLLGYTVLLTGLEWLSGALGIFVHVWWSVWWSAAFWLMHNSVMIGIMKVFRKQLYAGGDFR